MNFKDIIATPDMRKPSSGLLDPNKSSHLVKKMLLDQKLAKEAKKSKEACAKAEPKREELKKEEERKIAVEPVKRFTVTDFVSAHLK